MDKVTPLLFCAVLGFGICLGVIALTLEVCRRRWLTPRHADFHHHHAPGSEAAPVPRYGGIGLAAAFVIVISLPVDTLFGSHLTSIRWVIAGTALAMFGLGLWDDLHPVGARIKLAGQILVASAAYFLGLGIDQFKIPFLGEIIALGWFAWPVTVFWLVALTNLINLIDGVDGLAGGIALMLMLLLSVVGGDSGVVPFVAAGMAGALVAFLRYNFIPARIYLGDGGAFFLGFLVGCLTIRNSHKGTVAAALIAPLFVLALPILDTSLAIVRRGLHGLPLFRPDRRHLHHRLLESGLSRRQLILGVYAVTAFFLALGLVAFSWEGRYDAVALGLATLMLLLLAGRFSFSRRWFAVAGVLQRTLGARSEIRYALAQSRWLAMEGARGCDLPAICEDTAFVARKIGFVALSIHLEDTEKSWQMTGCRAGKECARESLPENHTIRLVHENGDCRCYLYQHRLPGHRNCWIELQTPDLNCPSAAEPAASPQPPRLTCHTRFGILAEVLAEAWAKSVVEWSRRNGGRLRFQTPPEVPAAPGQNGHTP